MEAVQPMRMLVADQVALDVTLVTVSVRGLPQESQILMSSRM
jgi:hypothetical protein